MSDMMLLGILRMPPDLWDSADTLNVMQRHQAYLEAANRLERMKDSHLRRPGGSVKPSVHVGQDALRTAGEQPK